MTRSADSNSSEMVTIRISRTNQERLKKLKKGNMTYDDVISQIVDDENWDVDKLDADLNKTLKTSKLIPFDEAFKDV
jgi:predicted CopG family antitoxin